MEIYEPEVNENCEIRCEQCGEFKTTCEFREDSYEKELSGESAFAWLCDDCDDSNNLAI